MRKTGVFLIILCFSMVLTACLAETEKRLVFDYDMEASVCDSGDCAVIQISVTNQGRSFQYKGDLTHHFSDPTLRLADGEYEIKPVRDTANTGLTEYTFHRKQTQIYTYYIDIPEEAPAGSYDLLFYSFGEKVEFKEVISITQRVE